MHLWKLEDEVKRLEMIKAHPRGVTHRGANIQFVQKSLCFSMSSDLGM